jgi:tRNA 2-selenouridine synthase
VTGRPDTSDYRALFLADAPMMDLRAPAEFTQGAFPTAHSLPLLSDDERAQVGVCYKNNGQDAAISLGHELVSGTVRQERLAAWCDFVRQHSGGYLYCWRGGLRSETVQQWLCDEGLDYPRVLGGYKAMRRFLLDEMERSAAVAQLVLIGGKTGTGKTRVIEKLTRCVDLEGLARHRGSTFGQMIEPQPSQVEFENALSIAMMKLLDGSDKRVYLEDEGRLIGRIALPQVLREKMIASPLAIVEESLESRIDVVVDDYILDLGQQYATAYGEQGPALHAQKLQDDLSRISKRLGGARHRDVSTMMGEAFAAQSSSGDPQAHRAWIAFLLGQYYDPMYEYQLSRRAGRRLFQGSREEVIAWAQEGFG